MHRNRRESSLVVSLYAKPMLLKKMYEGAEVVEVAHCETFRWLVEEKSSVEISDATSTARNDYVDWHRSDSGIFHILGKLGSGKPTLIKFLFGHERTAAELRTWAGQLNSIPTPTIHLSDKLQRISDLC
jgi:ABC-type molybdenum transport system ATPase subunit/photorepair protein PhrA